MSNFRPADGPRPSSSSRSANKAGGTSSLAEVFDFSNKGHKKSGSFSSRRLSEASASARRSDDVAADTNPSLNRWSSSTASSTSAATHRKTGSFSKRFSFGPSSALNPGLRSMSPSKRSRAADTRAEQGPPQVPDPTPNVLPNVDRFSPLTLPGAPTSTDRSPTRLPNAMAGHREHSNGADSPQRRLREPVLKAGSHLSDIMESEKTNTLSSRRIDPQVANGRPDSRRAGSRSATSRDSSPVKKSSAGSDLGANPPARRRSKKEKDKKIMLSKALKRANEAVQLDNDQGYDQAVFAYEEACSLLDAVLARTSTETERSKLTSIRETYSTRVQELRTQQQNARIGHAISDSQSSGPTIRESLDHAIEEDLEPVIGTAVVTNMASQDAPYTHQAPHAISDDTPTQAGQQGHGSRAPQPQNGTRYVEAPARSSFLDEASPQPIFTPPLSRPAPLSPRLRGHESDRVAPGTATTTNYPQRESGVVGAHSGSAMRDTGSWLATGVDDQRSDANSPRHSADSYEGVRRRDIRVEALDTEAEFDAALEAAIESAYNDGFEPYSATDPSFNVGKQDPTPRRTADPIGDQARSYALRQAKIQRLSQRSHLQIDPDLSMEFSDGGSGIDSDEEDRLLAAGRIDGPPPVPDTVTQPPVGVPRQSDSSGYSNQTWGSSTASSVNTGATSLGTVDENTLLPTVAEAAAADQKHVKQDSLSPPRVPPIPRTADSSPSREVRRDILGGAQRGESPLRDRRFSGHNKAKNLRIETQAPSRRTSDTTDAPKPQVREPSKLAPTAPPDQLPVRGASRLDPGSLACPYPSPNVAAFQPTATRTPTTPTFSKPASAGSGDPSPPNAATRSAVKSERPVLKHNASSLSLSKQTHLGVKTPDDATEPSPDTPMSFAFSGSTILTPPDRQDSRLGHALSTPMDATFNSLQPMNSAKMKIFDHEIHSATLPGSPNPEIQNGPKALEPCPDSLLLRPFWLLRSIQQTLTHTKGGYITTRLFVPHDVWKVKSSKLKGVEEKIANLDLLTAALLKLSAVNTEDADAVLEEMQALETVLDQAQSNLSKRLGSEVGVQGVSGLFKDAPSATSPTSGDPSAAQSGNEGNTTSTGSKTSSKSYLSSWRKLRNKSSSTNLSSSYTNKETSRDYITTMASVPMTSNNEVKIRHRTKQGQAGPPKMDMLPLEGPNANYASALARLCDAVQVLDQIARQAEDPGLKFTTQTHVGLELSARHAAEFFGFYVCRFVLQDLSMLTEKFVKRATEWVMS